VIIGGSKLIGLVHRYGIFKFRTTANSAPNTPSASHRLRPSMLNLDAISRNLFGAGSVSGRSQQSGSNADMFNTVSSKRRPGPVNRSSTMETNQLSYTSVSRDEASRKRMSSTSTTSGTSGNSASSDERKRISRMSTPASEVYSEEDEVLGGSPYKPGAAEGIRQSDVDLNERLQLARKNSKSMAALSPGPSRLGVRSVAELRGGVEERDREKRLGTRSVGDLRTGERARGDLGPAEEALRAVCKSHEGGRVGFELTMQYGRDHLGPRLFCLQRRRFGCGARRPHRLGLSKARIRRAKLTARRQPHRSVYARPLLSTPKRSLIRLNISAVSRRVARHLRRSRLDYMARVRPSLRALALRVLAVRAVLSTALSLPVPACPVSAQRIPSCV
jgi:hypothetical protein